jgi:hypothetical protein
MRPFKEGLVNRPIPIDLLVRRDLGITAVDCFYKYKGYPDLLGVLLVPAPKNADYYQYEGEIPKLGFQTREVEYFLVFYRREEIVYRLPKEGFYKIKLSVDYTPQPTPAAKTNQQDMVASKSKTPAPGAAKPGTTKASDAMAMPKVGYTDVSPSAPEVERMRRELERIIAEEGKAPGPDLASEAFSLKTITMADAVRRISPKSLPTEVLTAYPHIGGGVEGARPEMYLVMDAAGLYMQGATAKATEYTPYLEPVSSQEVITQARPDEANAGMTRLGMYPILTPGNIYLIDVKIPRQRGKAFQYRFAFQAGHAYNKFSFRELSVQPPAQGAEGLQTN